MASLPEALELIHKKLCYEPLYPVFDYCTPPFKPVPRLD
jgi:hypothetical protein